LLLVSKSFFFCRAAYLRLGATGNPNQEALCNARVEEIEPSLRYCAYNLSKKGGAQPAEIAKLLAEGDKVPQHFSRLLFLLLPDVHLVCRLL